jgi:hypothetical protein
VKKATGGRWDIYVGVAWRSYELKLLDSPARSLLVHLPTAMPVLSRSNKNDPHRWTIHSWTWAGPADRQGRTDSSEYDQDAFNFGDVTKVHSEKQWAMSAKIWLALWLNRNLSDECDPEILDYK